METIISSFEKILKEIKHSKKDVKVKVHDALKHFRVGRRGVYVNHAIRKLLEQYEIISTPDITTCWIYSEVTLSAIPTIRMHKDEKSVTDYDPVPRLNMLDAANIVALKKNNDMGIGLISVKPDDLLETAITQMSLNDFSQLPVMTSEREVKGMISWKSIGIVRVKGEQVKTVSDCMINIDVLDSTIPLFQAAKTILEKEVVLVRNQDKTICGIVTVTDLASQFVTMAEPFLLIEQIEKHLRKLLDGKFSEEELRKFAKTIDPNKNIGLLSDLSFGDYVSVIANSANFKKLELNIDRVLLIQRLDEVRNIRNDVMHFDPEPISAENLQILQLTNSFLAKLHR